jgi:hypothetical protein
MRHEVSENIMVDYQNTFSHSLEIIPTLFMGLLRIHRDCIPDIFRLA